MSLRQSGLSLGSAWRVMCRVREPPTEVRYEIEHRRDTPQRRRNQGPRDRISDVGIEGAAGGSPYLVDRLEKGCGQNVQISCISLGMGTAPFPTRPRTTYRVDQQKRMRGEWR